jgi:hypothetical protein
MDIPVATVNVATAGVHVVDVWMREDSCHRQAGHHDRSELRPDWPRAG